MPGTREDCRAAEKEAICEGRCKEKEVSSCAGRGPSPQGGRGRGSARRKRSEQGESGKRGKEKTVTANYEVKSIESRNEPLCLNYSLRHMWIGFSFP